MLLPLTLAAVIGVGCGVVELMKWSGRVRLHALCKCCVRTRLYNIPVGVAAAAGVAAATAQQHQCCVCGDGNGGVDFVRMHFRDRARI